MVVAMATKRDLGHAQIIHGGDQEHHFYIGGVSPVIGKQNYILGVAYEKDTYT